MILQKRRKGYFKNKYAKEWHVVTAFLLAVFVVILINGIGQ